MREDVASCLQAPGAVEDGQVVPGGRNGLQLHVLPVRQQHLRARAACTPSRVPATATITAFPQQLLCQDRSPGQLCPEEAALPTDIKGVLHSCLHGAPARRRTVVFAGSETGATSSSELGCWGVRSSRNRWSPRWLRSYSTSVLRGSTARNSPAGVSASSSRISDVIAEPARRMSRTFPL